MFTIWRTVNAVEQVGIELLLDGVHRFAEQVRLGADVQLDVIAGRFNPFDLAGPDEEHASAGFDDESLERVGGGLEPVHELEQPAFELTVGTTLDVFARALFTAEWKRSRSNGFKR